MAVPYQILLVLSCLNLDTHAKLAVQGAQEHQDKEDIPCSFVIMICTKA